MKGMLTNTRVINDGKRVVRNTLMLYFRMLLTMIISLFTSRVVLKTLGVIDYGIINAVGGFIALFGIFTNSMSRSISRFITYELGCGDIKRVERVFSTAVTIQFVVSAFIVIVIETFGLWFLHHKMVVPIERVQAATWALHCSVLTTVFSLVCVPYNATIVAHEKMDVFAYMGILDVSLKLLIVYLLYISSCDKLILYSVLLCFVGMLMRIVYVVYCKRHFEECNYHFCFDKILMRQMGGFAGWTFLDNGSYTLNNHGVSVLMNMFFGLAMNAARGIAITVEGAVRGFVANFAMALNPQIIKSYAEGNLNYMHKLVCLGAKYSCFLILFFSIPICIETHMLLKLWLGIVPDNTVLLVRFSFLLAVFMLVGDTLGVAITATGKIRRYQVWNSCLSLFVFPLTYITYKVGLPFYSFYLIYVVQSFIMVFIRAKIAARLVDMSVILYYKVLLSVLMVFISAFTVPMILSFAMPESVTRFFITCILSIMWSSFCIYVIGMGKQERIYVKNYIYNIAKKLMLKDGRCCNIRWLR